MASVLFIEGRRNGYTIGQCGPTMTVGELVDLLSAFEEDTPIYLINDNGYTFGSITERSFEERDNDEDEED